MPAWWVFFEQYHYVVQTNLKLKILLPQSPSGRTTDVYQLNQLSL